MNTALTLEQWLEPRSELVPDELRDRMRTLLQDILGQPASVEPMAGVAAMQLETLLQTGVTSRESALDLLAVDAIATYALELAASTGVSLSSSVASVMQSITRLMDPPDTSDP